MSEQSNDTSKNPGADKDEQHETARQLTEDALGAYARGEREKGDKMVEEAKRTDSSAIEEVIQDLDEDAGSDHTVPREMADSLLRNRRFGHGLVTASPGVSSGRSGYLPPSQQACAGRSDGKRTASPFAAAPAG
jgi:hypothetical protein